MAASSWRLKLDRAEEHLCDLKHRVGPLRERRVYPVSEGFEYKGESRSWTRRVNFPEPDEPMFQILAGELMFNARSSLDHLACALVPPAKRTRKIMRYTQFPIFTCDVHEIDPITGKHAHPDNWSQWVRMTTGLTDDAIPLIKGLQPYMFGPKEGPENHALAILNAFQNADKHRELVIFVNGLAEPIVRHTRSSGLITYESEPGGLPANRIVANGAVIETSPANDLPDVKVEVEGTMQILVGERDNGSNPFRGFPDVFESMLSVVRDACDRLEPFVP